MDLDQTYSTADRILAKAPRHRGEPVVATLARALVNGIGESILEVRQDGAIVVSGSGNVIIDATGRLVISGQSNAFRLVPIPPEIDTPGLPGDVSLDSANNRIIYYMGDGNTHSWAQDTLGPYSP